MSSPTSRTLATLRDEGWIAHVVEKNIHRPGLRPIKLDCFGFDVLAANPGEEGAFGIQACAGCDHAKRRTKLLANHDAAIWLAAGNRLAVWSWEKRRAETLTKKGKRSKRLVHHLRREEITLAMFVPQQASQTQEEQTREALP